jgi:hypothetical protein
MGLTIHYSARLRDPKRRPELTEEVADICRSLNWDFAFFDDHVEIPENTELPEPLGENPRTLHLKGIYFTPPESETVWLTFTPSGRLAGLFYVLSVDLFDDPETIYTVSVKTQFAGIEYHAALVHLLKYLEKKYFTDMEVTDEGYYWENLDRQALEQQFARYEQALRVVGNALAGKALSGEDAKYRAFAERIKKIIDEALED